MGIAGDGGVPVSGPECRPQRFGLESVAQTVPHGDGEFTRGIEWDELPCGFEAGIVSGQCPVLPEQQSKEAARGFTTKFADAFTVYAGYVCSTGGTPLGVAWDSAEKQLRRKWWRAVERALWAGVDQDDNAILQSFAQRDPDSGDALVQNLTPGGGAVSLTDGVSVLEEYFGECSGCEGVIHVPRHYGPYLSERSQLARDGDVMRIASTGTPVALGSGYTTLGPGATPADPFVAAPAGEAWLYGTGGVVLNHGGMFFTPDKGDDAGAVDRAVNDITVFAEKPAALQIGCCLGAVRVTIESCCLPAA